MTEETARKITAAAQTLDGAYTGLFEIVKQLDRKDPKFVVTMRKYGLIEKMQLIGLSLSDLATELGAAFRAEDIC